MGEGRATSSDSMAHKTNHSRARCKPPSALRNWPRLDSGRLANRLPQNNKPARGRDVMKFGIFYELQLPRPWQAGDELRLYQDALTQLETADRLGYDYAWVVEHHFLEEYSHSPSPESFLAAASERTSNIRLGHGIFQLTTNHPARVAERVAVLDLLSRGRVEFGMGESASITELTPFGRDMETKKEVFEEAVRAIFPMFGEGGSEHHGKYFDIPLRNVVPKPVQKPHAPLWMACSQLPTIERAGQNGFGALGFQFVSADAAHAWVHAYYNAITKRLKKLADYEINPTWRWCRSSCAPKPMRRLARVQTAPPFSSSRCAFTARRRTASVRRRALSTCGTNTTNGSARTRKPRRR